MQELLNLVDLQNMVTQFVTRFIEFIPSLFAAIIILVAAYVGSRIVRAVLHKALERANFNKVLRQLLLDNILHYGIVILGVIMALSQLGVNVTAALAGVGVVGIAIGFAAQDTVANVISGILIFWDKPFVVGDWIESEGQFGKVTYITLRTTRIRTPSNTYIVVPNKRIIDEVLINFSKHGELRVDASVGIAYKENIAEARKVLLAAVSKMDHILEDPAPDVVVDELDDSSINLQVRVWIESADDKNKTYFQLIELAKTALDEAGIQIPFPHMQLFVDTVEKRVWKEAGKLIAGKFND